MGTRYRDTRSGAIFERWLDGYKPLRSQRRFHECSSRFKGFSGPIGTGKTQAICHEALQACYLNSGCLGLIGAPTYPMLRDVTKLTFMGMLAEENIPFYERRAENAVVLTEPMSTIIFRAVEEYERLRGTNLAWFCLDELTYCRLDAWLRLEARLREPKAQRLSAFAAWTPKGYDWVYRRFVAPDKPVGYEVVLASPRENIYLPDDFYDRLETSYDERFYAQEVLGQYLNIYGGRVYFAFDREPHVRALEYDPTQPLWWSLDFNIDPMCSVIGQFIEHPDAGRSVTVLREITLHAASTWEACETFLEYVTPWMIPGRPLNIFVYGDASGGNRSTTGQTDWNVVRQFFGRYRELAGHLKIKSGNPLVKDGVNQVNGLFRNAAGQARITVSPSCQELICDLEQVVWKSDRFGNMSPVIEKEKDPKRTHWSDALGYMIDVEFPIRRAVASPGQRIRPIV